MPSPSSPPLPPPPLSVIADDPEVISAVRKRFKSKHLFVFSVPACFPCRRLSHTSSPSTGTLEPSISDNDTPIYLESSSIKDQTHAQDLYKWAVLYENQRGTTVFSVPYYSKLSLLPADPLPFTLPCTSLKRSEQPIISLETYPLPDGEWRWVSRAWMVDMRTDHGEVQYDGFEYNWSFRKHNWRAQVGPLNTGGWVRRRRWVRLMMRPARSTVPDDDVAQPATPMLEGPSGATNVHLPQGLRLSAISVLSGESGSELDWKEVETLGVWQGGVDADWARCHAVLRIAGRDGRMIELWRAWINQTTNHNYIIDVLRAKSTEILDLFVFPESRAQFERLLALGGLDVRVLGKEEQEFWSYNHDMGVHHS